MRYTLIGALLSGLAVATMRGKSYLSIGGTSMGIAGSIVDQPMFERFLGMRVEAVDMSEVTRRLDEQIYDPVEFEKALAWTQEYCKEGKGYVTHQAGLAPQKTSPVGEPTGLSCCGRG